MREYKFRAWDKEHKEMYHEVECGIVSVQTIEDNEDLSFNSLLQNKSWIVMQWTGLKDKNNKDIYEGDIVKITELRITGHDEICNLTGDIKYEASQKGLVVKFNNYQYIPIVCGYRYIEVVGNIYENPEMIKE